MFPYRDDNPTLATPVVTVVLIGLNVAAWILVQGMGAEPYLSKSVCELGLIPGEYLGRVPAGLAIPMSETSACVVDADREWLTPITSMFLHGGWFHLIGNMWFLWLFGNNVEDSMGPVKFVMFYLLGGLAAVALQVAIDPQATVPTVGASGAIAGVLGGYVLLFPRARVITLIFIVFFVTIVELPALAVLGFWFVQQVLFGWFDLTATGNEGGVAYFAHIGGFVFGLAAIKLFADDRKRRRSPAAR
jgi:membrane associated rhomboid family serine protease